MSTVTRLRPRPRPLRADVPPFDPGNDAHLRAWEAMWDLGKLGRKRLLECSGDGDIIPIRNND